MSKKNLVSFLNTCGFFPSSEKKAQGGVVIYLRHLACWETLGWELTAGARHVTQTDGDFLKFSRRFGGLKSWNLQIFVGFSKCCWQFWCQKPCVPLSFFLTFPHVERWSINLFLDQKKDDPKNINFDQGFLHNNDTSLPLIPSGPYCWSHVREWLEAQWFFKFPPWFVDSLHIKKSWQFFVTFFWDGWVTLFKGRMFVFRNPANQLIW